MEKSTFEKVQLLKAMQTIIEDNIYYDSIYCYKSAWENFICFDYCKNENEKNIYLIELAEDKEQFLKCEELFFEIASELYKNEYE